MIYTSYEMIRDCRENRPEGWRFFVVNYVPAARKLLEHYGGPAAAGALDGILTGIRKPESSLFQSLEPAPERWFLAELRQQVVAAVNFPEPAIAVDLETVAAAFEPLTMVEKQAAWTEGMGYTPEKAGAMLRMAPATVSKMRDRASDLLRSKVDSWNRSLLRDNGPDLGRAAAQLRGAECPPAKTFLDVLDGRSTWRDREDVERHVSGCSYCIDHFCRMAEVIELIREIRPLTEAEAAPYYRLLGVAPAKKKGWKRLIGA